MMKRFDENPPWWHIWNPFCGPLGCALIMALNGCAALEVEPKNREPVAPQPDCILIFESEREGKVFFEHFLGEPKDVFHFRGDYDKR